MFDATSRYAEISTAVITEPGGRELRYVLRRFLPPADANGTFAEHLVTEGERLDHIAARYLGDPELFWQLADINNAMRPEELTARIGRRLRAALLSG